MARKLKEVPRLNLIPILDAIFIFIFFLLMSAQFLDIYEIGSDAPITSIIKSDDNKKKPLNLILEISKSQIKVKTGLDEVVQKSFGFDQLKEMNTFLQTLKRDNPKETSAILKPGQNVEYDSIIKIIDYTKETIVDKKSKVKPTPLFEEVIFETF